MQKKTVSANFKKNVAKIQPPALGLKRVGTKVAGKAASSLLKKMELRKHGEYLRKVVSVRAKTAGKTANRMMAKAADKAKRMSR